jgi:hypothetical protein
MPAVMVPAVAGWSVGERAVDADLQALPIFPSSFFDHHPYVDGVCRHPPADGRLSEVDGGES